jgi:GPH family glycoside/pentoside/hexuronide:cation symporter
MKNKGVMSPHIFDSRIKSANVQNSERWLAYFLGPSVIMTMFAISGQTYLNMFYTDVLKMTPLAGGIFLALMPALSKVLDAITNLIMGWIIERTHSRHGKARPWILISGPLLAVTGILLFTVPQASMAVQAVWVTISYNLFFSMAFTMYNISHTLMVPLSTRNSKQRDTLAMISSMGASLIPGTVVAILFPMLFLPFAGVNPYLSRIFLTIDISHSGHLVSVR